MLSDANFSKEECEDLSQRVNSGELPKLTTLEIEEEAKSLHRVIVNDWIKRELAQLQIQIDFANEKGRREQFVEYLNKRELLKTEAEQMRLLDEVPKVIAEPIPVNATRELKKEDKFHPRSVLYANSVIGSEDQNDETVCNTLGGSLFIAFRKGRPACQFDDLGMSPRHIWLGAQLIKSEDQKEEYIISLSRYAHYSTQRRFSE